MKRPAIPTLRDAETAKRWVIAALRGAPAPPGAKLTPSVVAVVEAICALVEEHFDKAIDGGRLFPRLIDSTFKASALATSPDAKQRRAIGHILAGTNGRPGVEPIAAFVEQVEELRPARAVARRQLTRGRPAKADPRSLCASDIRLVSEFAAANGRWPKGDDWARLAERSPAHAQNPTGLESVVKRMQANTRSLRREEIQIAANSISMTRGVSRPN